MPRVERALAYSSVLTAATIWSLVISGCLDKRSATMEPPLLALLDIYERTLRDEHVTRRAGDENISRHGTIDRAEILLLKGFEYFRLIHLLQT